MILAKNDRCSVVTAMEMEKTRCRQIERQNDNKKLYSNQRATPFAILVLKITTQTLFPLFRGTKRADSVSWKLAWYKKSILIDCLTVKKHSYRLSHLILATFCDNESESWKPPLQWLHWNPVSQLSLWSRRERVGVGWDWLPVCSVALLSCVADMSNTFRLIICVVVSSNENALWSCLLRLFY